MRHDACRSTPDFKYAGQNLGYRASTGNFQPLNDTIKATIQSWYDEYKDAVQADLDSCCSSRSGKVIGHFTQVVRDKATHIGCAVSRYTKDNLWKSSLVACNYAITNIQGRPVYVSGNPASGCTTGRNPKYPSLCSVNEKIAATP
jgi:Cysteine-rich secretory protein family